MKSSKRYLQIAVASPLPTPLVYLASDEINIAELKPGIRIQVPFRNKKSIGILLATSIEAQVAAHKLKTIEKIIDIEPVLSTQIIQLATWASDYYHHPIGEVILTCLPTYLRQGRTPELPDRANESWQVADVNLPELNSAQLNAITSINAAQNFQTFLLNGVTGSGKTEVYLQAIAEIIAKRQQALVLVPEIGLTPQTIARFQQRFAAPIVVLHSGLNERQRAASWLQAKNGDAAIIIGTRSAIFTPLANPGIIILDEEHDLSFKQQSGFRYSARDCAVRRGQLENIPVILGSATPSLETLNNTKRKRFIELSLPERAGQATSPQIHCIDLRNQPLDAGLSPRLLNSVAQHLAADGQVLLFLNRRGFAPVLMCHACGWSAQCQRCDSRLTLHQKPERLFCHHCNSQLNLPKQCPSCQCTQLLALGLGTERVEQALLQHFPNHKIARIDRDNTKRRGSFDELLASVQSGASRILLGTQMLTKGHHFPRVTLVGIIDVDSALFSADFRASERMGQLIIQVAGRAGRAEHAGEVLLQTHHPAHPLLLELLQKGYGSFAKTLLAEREITTLPPFGYMALLRAEAVKPEAALAFLNDVKNIIGTLKMPHIESQGPNFANMARKAGVHRAQLLLSSPQRANLQNLLKHLRQKLESLKSKQRVRWSIDVDPMEII